MPKYPKIILVIEDSRAHGRALLRGISRYARFNGPWTIYRDVYNPSYGHGAYIKNEVYSRFEKIAADGVITRNPEKTRQLTKKGIPTIIAISQKNPPKGTSYLTINHSAVGKMGAEYFLDKGYKNYAFCGYKKMYWSICREKAFAETLQKHGYESSAYNAPTKNKLKKLKFDSEIEHLALWLDKLSKPIAIMACNDNRAANVIEAAKIAGIHIPEEIAILGVDNDDLICNMSNPPLSSIILNAEKGGYQAAELLDEMMKSDERVIKKIFIEPVQIIERESTDILAVEDKDVSNAMRFIRENKKEPIQVSDVIESVFTSRRCLQKKFRKYFNRTILNEIKNTRIEYAKQLLLDTHMNISEISDHMNFSGVNSFSRYFKEYTKLSPLEYRKKYGPFH